MPHGAIAFEPWPKHGFLGDNSKKARQESVQIHNAAINVGNSNLLHQVQTWIIISPHEIAVEKDFLFFQGDITTGNGDESEANYTYTKTPQITLTINQKLTSELMQAVDQNSSALFSPADLGLQLLWGSVVPSYFLKPNERNQSVVVISLPTKRYVNNAVPIIPELLRFGESITKIIQKSNTKIGLCISADLAHTHLCDGPYGCSPTAELFDKAISSWIHDTKNKDILLVEAAKLAPQALSCGFAGFVIFSKILEFIPGTLIEFFGPVHPGYYGMLTALFSF